LFLASVWKLSFCKFQPKKLKLKKILLIKKLVWILKQLQYLHILCFRYFITYFYFLKQYDNYLIIVSRIILLLAAKPRKIFPLLTYIRSWPSCQVIPWCHYGVSRTNSYLCRSQFANYQWLANWHFSWFSFNIILKINFLRKIVPMRIRPIFLLPLLAFIVWVRSQCKLNFFQTTKYPLLIYLQTTFSRLQENSSWKWQHNIDQW